MLNGSEFALCLTHDVDRPYKTFQSLYYSVTERRLSHLKSLIPGANPYWQFERIMEGEEEREVRSAFYFLSEDRLFRDRPIREWFTVDGWQLFAGRYSLDDDAIVDLIASLNDGGWEIGLHGSYDSYRDRDRLRAEKRRLETVVGNEIMGGRQHYLNLEIPTTWRHHADIGLKYDASLGSSETYGFQHGYDIHRPFGDYFVQFPLTIMETTLPNVTTDTESAWGEIERLLHEADEHDAVMTVLWHPRYFNESEFPGYAPLYWRLIDTALEMGAWVGPPGELYDQLEHPCSKSTI